MTFPRQAWAAAAAALLCLSSEAAPETPDSSAPPGLIQSVLLKNGASLSGEILAKKSGTVVVDLGYAVLEVPTREIARIEEPAKSADTDTPAERSSHGVFFENRSKRPLSVSENVARCGGAVVEVRTGVGMGSGFVIHPDGYVVTAQHVIAGEDKITVTRFLPASKEQEKAVYRNVRIVAMSPDMDLALLKIEDSEKGGFPFVPLGDSDALETGEGVFVIGSPLGMERSVSQGIVSSRNRPVHGRLMIQTTTQINPGNSGGPLFNHCGEAVGVCDLKLAREGVEGMGFAVTADDVKRFLRNRDAFAFDPRNPNAGFRYNAPPKPMSKKLEQENVQ